MQSLVPIKDAVDVRTYNDKLIDHSLPDGACVLAQNCFLDNNEIIQRFGYSMIANDTGEGKPNLGFLAYETPTLKQLLKINDNAGGTAANLFYWTGTGNWVKVTTSTFTAGLPVSMVVANGNVYMSNGTDTVKKWNGTTLSTVAAIPARKYLAWFHNFLFSMDKSRVYISAISDPETFPVNSYIDLNPDDGDQITGNSQIKDELTISKYNKMYTFQGWTEASFSISQVNEKLAAYGATSHDSFTNIGSDLLFMSFGGGIPHIRSLRITEQSSTTYGGIITNDQEGTMRGLSKGQLNKAASVFDGRKAWFFMPNGSSTFNDLTLVYDTVTQGVTKHTGIYAARGVLSTITGTQAVYFADSRNAKVYVFDTSTDDDGADIEFIYKSKRFQPDQTRYNKFKYLYLQYDRTSTGSLGVYTSVDDYDPELVDTLDLNAPGSVFPFTFPFLFSATTQGDARVELPYGVNRNIQVMFYKKDQTAPAKIHDYTFYARQKPLREETPFPAS